MSKRSCEGFPHKRWPLLGEPIENRARSFGAVSTETPFRSWYWYLHLRSGKDAPSIPNLSQNWGALFLVALSKHQHEAINKNDKAKCILGNGSLRFPAGKQAHRRVTLTFAWMLASNQFLDLTFFVFVFSPHLCVGFLLFPLVVRAPRLLLLLLPLVSVSLTHSLTHSHSLTCTHSTHTHSLTLTHSHSVTHTHSHSLTLTHSHSVTHTHSHSLTHTHSHSLTHSLTLTHTHSLTLTLIHSLSVTHSLTHSLTRSLTHSHSLTHGSCLEGQDVVARRGACEIVAGAALWRCRCEIVAGAALWRCRCRSRGRRSILCIWVCVCVAGVAFSSCLEGQDVVARAAGGVRNRGRRSTLAMPLPKSWQAQHFADAVAEVVAGAAFCASGCVFVWQGSHSAAV